MTLDEEIARAERYRDEISILYPNPPTWLWTLGYYDWECERLRLIKLKEDTLVWTAILQIFY